MSDVSINSVRMLCPRCGARLAMSERQSIEVDYCPNCRGVWLDNGELDRIIERSLASMQANALESDRPPAASPWLSPGAHIDTYGDRNGHGLSHSYEGHDDDGHPSGRRRSWFEKLMD